MALKFVIFDFDGTIGESYPQLVEAFQGVMHAKRYEVPTQEECKQLQGMDIKGIRETLGLNWIQMSQVITGVQNGLRERFDKIEPVDGIEDVLIELKDNGMLTGLMTSNDTKRIADWLKYRGFEKYFDHLTNDRGFFAKSKQLWRLVKAAQIDPTDTVLVCDEVRDLQAARQVGMQSIAVSWGHQSGDRLLTERPEAIVETPQKLKEILSK